MLIAVIADDLTGAADTGVQFVHAGYRTAVFFRATEVIEDNLDAVVFDTDSRAMPAGFAAKRVVDAAHAARGARIVYKKLDSTLRGNVAAELAAALGGARRDRAIVAPAFPAAGRATVGGIQRVHGVPVDETEMANDPHIPVREAHVPSLLADAFSSVGLLSVEDLAEPDLVRSTLEDYDCVVADAERDADLEALVRAVPDPAGLLWVGSAGLALALGSVYPGPYAGTTRVRRTPVRPVLVVVGSLSGVAREQVRRLVEAYGEVDVPVDSRAPNAVREAVGAARRALAGGTCAVVHSPEERSASGESVLGSLSEVAALLSEEGLFEGLVLTGGATAVGVAQRLGASGIRLEGEVETGVPMGLLAGPRPYPVVTKAGGFGRPDTLVGAVEALSMEEWNP
ncbi:MAG: four-carbon acid sugar kinase family protein [Actinomycetota bacterium]|nr:four-carbon acid sugar kinase family protein [Actinomycetota bacterium]